MKSPRKPTPPARQLPKARVMWASKSAISDELRLHDLQEKPLPAHQTFGDWDYTIPVAVLPLPAAQARALTKFANMTEGERVGELLKLIFYDSKLPNLTGEQCRAISRLALQRLGLLGEGVGR